MIILQGSISLITRTVYLTSGFWNFWQGRHGSRTYRWLNFRWDSFWKRQGCRRTYNGILIFIHAGTASRKTAYLLGFLRSFSLRISVFGHIDDLARGPAGRVFPELDLFQYRLSGFWNFWQGRHGSRTYCWLNFQRDGIGRRRGYGNTSNRI